MTDTLTDLFGPVISTYSRADAIEDGVLVDATIGDFSEVSRQHYKYPIAMTAAVFDLIERAVNHPTHCNDYRGVWHDILHMSKCAKVRQWDTGCEFRVMITGTGRTKWHNLKIACGPGDDAEPVLTVMLPHED